jgi:hypothetical protein
MPFIKLEDFSGIVPRTGPTQLEPNQAQVANNVKLQSRELRSWSEATLEYTPTTPNVQTIYSIDSPSGDKYWLEWATDVDMVPGPVADVNEFRYYYTGDGVPKKTNYAMATGNGIGPQPYPIAYLNMGVPAPVGAPTLTPSSSTAPTENRAYVYTYVSTFGTVKEESAPSPAGTVLVSTAAGTTVTVSGFSTAPTTGYNITHRRIYRTITGATNVVYSFVAEIPLATTSFVDNLSVTQLGAELQTLFWTPPPNNLKGLVAMPNGILAGFIGNQVWFSEPYYPHAWPESYMLTVDYPIVGLGVYETNLVVLTTRFPYLISGVSPTSMSQQKLPIPQPCVSKRSITSDQYGVLYASPNGLVSLGQGTQDVVTVPLYTRDEWQALNPASMVAAVYNNLYMGFTTINGVIEGFVIARGDIPPLVKLNFPTRSLFVDRSTSNIYAISNLDNKVYQLDSSTVNFTVYEWKSKKFVMPNPLNFGAVKVQADYEFMDDIDAYNAYVQAIKDENIAIFTATSGKVLGDLNTTPIHTLTINGSLLKDLPEFGTNRYITLIVYADGQQIFAEDVLNQEPIRMPAAKKGYVYEVIISGNTPVRMVCIASSIAELRELTT